MYIQILHEYAEYAPNCKAKIDQIRSFVVFPGVTFPLEKSVKMGNCLHRSRQKSEGSAKARPWSVNLIPRNELHYNQRLLYELFVSNAEG